MDGCLACMELLRASHHALPTCSATYLPKYLPGNWRLHCSPPSRPYHVRKSDGVLKEPS